MKETDPKQTKRAKAYELWIKAPNPMVTFFKTLDVTPLIKKRLFKYYLTISFQYHHTQIDGAHAGKFLANLQKEIYNFK